MKNKAIINNIIPNIFDMVVINISGLVNSIPPIIKKTIELIRVDCFLYEFTLISIRLPLSKTIIQIKRLFINKDKFAIIDIVGD